jgi:membrane fusion protein (multidrug efflux system)
MRTPDAGRQVPGVQRTITEGKEMTAALARLQAARLSGLMWMSCAVLLPACSRSGPAAAPAQEVSTLRLAPQPAAVTEDYVAEIEAHNTVEVRPRVGGVLEQQAAREGDRVKPGQLLFVIDRQPYIAALAQAKANLAQAQAAVEQSKRDLARVQPLSAIDAVSQQELDAAVAKNDANRASVEAAQAAVQTARLNLGYCEIRSPINGLMGRALLRLGGLVTASTTLLTTVYETDTMYVNFSISEQRLLQMQRDLGHAPNQDARTPPPFRVFLLDGSEYTRAPRLNFIDAAVDARTGTLPIRLEVDNPQGLLRAGQFARVQVVARQQPDALVLPQRAVLDLQGKNYVWIVDAQGKAQQRDVRMGPRLGHDWLVEQGLQAGETVIVDGVQRLKPGTPVKATPLPPEEAEAKSQNLSAPAPAPAKP